MIIGFAILLVVSAGAAALNVPGQEYSRDEVESRNRRAVDLTIPRLGDLQPGQSGVLNQSSKYINYN